MLEAMARKKASAFMARARSEASTRQNRPQEDMLTSAIFGSISLLPMADQHRALDLLLGKEFTSSACFDASADIDISLWPSFNKRSVEPDVVLSCAGKTVIIEVKWHACLRQKQLDHQVKAVSESGRMVVAVVVLGKSESDSQVEELIPLHRPWQQVSADLYNAQWDTTGVLNVWIKRLFNALQSTGMNMERYFSGFSAINISIVSQEKYIFNGVD